MTNLDHQTIARIQEQLELNEEFIEAQRKRIPTLKNSGVMDLQMLDEIIKLKIVKLFVDSGLMSRMEAEAQIRIAGVRVISNLLDYLKEGTTKWKDSENEKPIN